MNNERITLGPLVLFGTQSGVIVSVIVRSLRDFYIGPLTVTIDEWQSLRALAGALGAARRDAEELRAERDALKREVDAARELRAQLAAVMKARDEACDIAAEGLHVFSPSHLNPDAVRTRIAELRKVGKEES